jgi:hypothetical protein
MTDPPANVLSRRAAARALSVAIATCLAPFRGRDTETLNRAASSSAELEPGQRRHEPSDVGEILDVKSRGARGDGRADDWKAIQSTIDEIRNAGGGTVFFPMGRYLVSRTQTLPSGTDRQIRLRGDTRRGSIIAGANSGQTIVRVGDMPGRSGSSSPVAYYGLIEDLTITAGNAVNGRGIHLVQTALVTLARVNIEGFHDGDGVGLHLQGSTTSAGLGTPSTPHALDNRFYDLLVVDCQHPVVIQNADENNFIALRIGMTLSLRTPLTSAGVEIRQGRNNRFFGTTIQGDVSDSASYVGVRFRAPVNEHSEPGGDVKGNNFHGLVIEGCAVGLWFERSPDTAGNSCRDVNFSICRESFRDDGRQNGYGNSVVAPLHGINYTGARGPYGDAVTFPANTEPNATIIPSVRNANVFACANSVPTRIDTFGDGANGQIIVVRLDAFTTLVHGGQLRLAGGRDFLGGAGDTITLANFGGAAWFELARSANH